MTAFPQASLRPSNWLLPYITHSGLPMPSIGLKTRLCLQYLLPRTSLGAARKKTRTQSHQSASSRLHLAKARAGELGRAIAVADHGCPGVWCGSYL